MTLAYRAVHGGHERLGAGDAARGRSGRCATRTASSRRRRRVRGLSGDERPVDLRCFTSRSARSGARSRSRPASSRARPAQGHCRRGDTRACARCGCRARSGRRRRAGRAARRARRRTCSRPHGWSLDQTVSCCGRPDRVEAPREAYPPPGVQRCQADWRSRYSCSFCSARSRLRSSCFSWAFEPIPRR